jgi:hypothetical protein
MLLGQFGGHVLVAVGQQGHIFRHRQWRMIIPFSGFFRRRISFAWISISEA